MDKLIEWAKGKAPGLVMMAQQLAVGAEPCFEFLKLIKAGERIKIYQPASDSLSIQLTSLIILL